MFRIRERAIEERLNNYNFLSVCYLQRSIREKDQDSLEKATRLIDDIIEISTTNFKVEDFPSHELFSSNEDTIDFFKTLIFAISIYGPEGRTFFEEFAPKHYLLNGIKDKIFSEKNRESLAFIQNFSINWGKYDAYSLTKFEDLEQYISTLLDLKKHNSTEMSVKNKISIFPKCYHQFIIDEFEFRKQLKRDLNFKTIDPKKGYGNDLMSESIEKSYELINSKESDKPIDIEKFLENIKSEQHPMEISTNQHCKAIESKKYLEAIDHQKEISINVNPYAKDFDFEKFIYETIETVKAYECNGPITARLKSNFKYPSIEKFLDTYLKPPIKITPKSLFGRFVGLKIWDIKYEKKCSRYKALDLFLDWYNGKYPDGDDELNVDSLKRYYEITRHAVMNEDYFKLQRDKRNAAKRKKAIYSSPPRLM